MAENDRFGVFDEIMSDDPPLNGKASLYRKPPVIQRVITLAGDISPEEFAIRTESWGQIVAEFFPLNNPIVEWVLQTDEIKLGENVGVPLFENIVPQVKITPRFERRNADGKTVWTLRCPPDGLSLSLHAELGQPHSFEELHHQMAVWLPQWITHFDVKGVKVVMLDYVNLLGTRTTPRFIQEVNNSLEIDRVLKVFSRFEGSQLSIIQPYDCHVGFLYSADPMRALRVRVHGLPPSQFGPEVRVDFQGIMHKNSLGLVGISEVLDELNVLHGMVIERFNQVFTDEAKESFR